LTQYFFADESGNPSAERKTQPYFVIAMAELSDRGRIFEFQTIRKRLNLASSFEFHYYHMTAIQKRIFFEGMIPLSFRVRAAVILKDDLPPFYRDFSPFDLTVYLFAQIILRAPVEAINNDILIIDSATDAFRTSLRIRLTEACNRINRPRPFKKIAASTPINDDGLQLADMLAGAIREYTWKNVPAYFQTFSGKVADLWMVK
jgi:hypothetical protein